jgi:hypothetical protein
VHGEVVTVVRPIRPEESGAQVGAGDVLQREVNHVPRWDDGEIFGSWSSFYPCFRIAVGHIKHGRASMVFAESGEETLNHTTGLFTNSPHSYADGVG